MSKDESFIMIPKKGQTIKCLLKNNIVVEGVVDYWSNTRSLLKSLHDNDSIILYHTDRDVIAVRIKSEQTQNAEFIKTNLEKKFKETYDSPSQNDLRIKTLAELKSLLIEQEKKIVSEKIKNHEITDITLPKYQQPNIFYK